MSTILSEQTEREIAQSLLTRFDELVIKREQQQNKFPYIQQAELLRELKISTSYLEKLKKHGLKQVVLEDGDRLIWYSKRQLATLMDDLAE